MDRETLLRVEPYRCRRCLEQPWNCHCRAEVFMEVMITIVFIAIMLAVGL